MEPSGGRRKSDWRRRRNLGRWSRAAWLLADAALVALVAGPIEVLLVFLLSPDRPMTLGSFAAASAGLLPQIVLVFVLLAPGIVLFAGLFSVGRATRSGIAARYVMRFALLDGLLLLLAAVHQWQELGALLPGRARVSLALMVSLLAAASVVLLILVLVEFRRPELPLGPWLAALAIGLVVGLTLAAQVRRVRVPDPPPVQPLPGFTPTARVLLIEFPGLGPADLRRAVEGGVAAPLAGLAAAGVQAYVPADRVSDPVALHVSLITGQSPTRHGVFGAARYKPVNDGRSFAVLPRGLLLRPLVHTPLWRRIPATADSVRVPSLPRIADGLALRHLMVGDPLGWSSTAGVAVVPRSELAPARRVALPGQSSAVLCADPGDVAATLFDVAESTRPLVERYRETARRLLAEDLCALALARRGLLGDWQSIHVRLSGYDSMAARFEGDRPEQGARAVSSTEQRTFGQALPRYLHALAPDLRKLLGARNGLGSPTLVVLISPVGVRPRQDLRRLAEGLLGIPAATGTHSGASGLILVEGPGVRRGAKVAPFKVSSVLPTLLHAVGLPYAAEMGVVRRDIFASGSTGERAGVAVDSFAEMPD